MTHSTRSFQIETLDRDETLHFCDTYVTSRQSARRLLPLHAARAPIGRLFAGRYWLSTLETLEEPLELIAPSPTHVFSEIALAHGETFAVELGSLAALRLPEDHAGPPFESYLWGIFRPGCWSWGHPIPTLFHGPARIVLCAEALCNAAADRSYEPTQLVAFDVRSDLRVVHNDAKTITSTLLNAVTFSNTLRLNRNSPNVYIRDFGSRKRASKHLAGRFLMLLMWTAWLSVFIVWLSGEQGWL